MSSRSLLTLALGACLLSDAAQSQIASDPLGAESLLRPTTDITLSGDVTVSRLEVPRHVTVWLSSDLTLWATGDIVIEGAMAALPGAHVDGDGIDLTLVSHGSITLDGVLAAGDGLAGDAPGVAGGHGGDLKLLAPPQSETLCQSVNAVGGQLPRWPHVRGVRAIARCI